MNRLYVIATAVALSFTWAPSTVRSDSLGHSYDADVVPYHPSAGWLLINPCDPPCIESVFEGHFVLSWAQAGNLAIYGYRITAFPDPDPPSIWFEWRFRSNHPIGPNFYTCDASFLYNFRGIIGELFMYGDAAISFSGNDVVSGLALDEFHTYRLESPDGQNYRISVNGRVFTGGFHASGVGTQMQMIGGGGCISDQIPNMRNEWDYARYGTISFGEQVVTTDPPAGVLDAVVYGNLDRFLVTFDSPNYVYINDIAVDVIGPPGTPVPQVIATRRRDNGNPEDVEIVLDRPLPAGATTRFTLTDGVAVNVIEYTLTAALDGACCQPDGTCADATDPPCTLDGGTFVEGQTCSAPDFCCLPGGDCALLPHACCMGAGGTLATDPNCDADGDGVPDCIDVCPGVDDAKYAPHCATAIPAATAWGAAILALLLLTAAKLAARANSDPA